MTTDTNPTEVDTSKIDQGEITFTRVYQAPRELVFACMTEPEHLTKFWGPIGMSTPIDKITVDLRPGGLFETIMVNDETGDEYPMRGFFTEVVAPERLAWTESESEGGPTSAITFIDLGDGTTKTVTRQTNMPAMYLSEESRAGMQTSFLKMDAYLATLV